MTAPTRGRGKSSSEDFVALNLTTSEAPFLADTLDEAANLMQGRDSAYLKLIVTRIRSLRAPDGNGWGQ